ncbi:uncharacterized protein OCT59_029709 [Rhizophagus irregularis]|uniref:uncharacterized protein n=1 Tax=Rhizophagus irregularis TaxID=588596 RepID=UPI000CC79A58|nr:hypothetical protein OCT59_029709 [Rhizophagus irregularis]CAB5184473.1 unnamed protein product [Rhizophagus irregularis]CAB5339342.1 unnamed protein product [Rhizophagus irregularis]
MSLFTIGAEYERERQERIEQNRAILAKLGLDNDNLLKLSLKKQIKPKLPKPRVITENNGSGGEGEQERRRPSRRSERIKEQESRGTPKKIKFVEKTIMKSCRKISRNHLGRRIYGGRIYDSEHGTTCHQCRQKTIEEKVQCTNILEDGSLCKVMMDERCLLGRYGQTLQDARESGEWNCPKCRDVCNCSFCRKKKGLSATGILKHIAIKAGYNSVMEYLGDS